jgi:methionyl-tRNA formyltransferase
VKILFAGTPEIAVPTLRALAEHFSVGVVLTSPDKPQKRSSALLPTPVKAEALSLGLPVLQFEHLRTEERNIVATYGCDTLVCFAYGNFFGPKFLGLFSLALNVHPSLLPQLRGPSPIQGAILDGLSETGISIQKLASEMDAGDIAEAVHIPLCGDETTLTLTEKVAALAPSFVVHALSSPLSFTPQRGEPTYCKLIGKEDGVVDWKRSAKEISSQVRGLYPWPKATTTYLGGTLFLCGVDRDVSTPVPEGFVPGQVVGKDKQKGLGIATGNGVLWVTRLQKAMKKEMDALSFINGEKGILSSLLGE